MSRLQDLKPEALDFSMSLVILNTEGRILGQISLADFKEFLKLNKI